MYISEIEEIEELTGYIEGCGDCGCSSGNSGGSEPPPTIMGGNHLNAIDIQSLTISDLINTSTIQTDYNRIICSATGGSGTYAYKVWYENATATQEISIVDGSTVGLDGQLVAILPSDWYTTLGKIWVIVTDTAGVKATKYFAFVGT